MREKYSGLVSASFVWTGWLMFLVGFIVALW